MMSRKILLELSALLSRVMWSFDTWKITLELIINSLCILRRVVFLLINIFDSIFYPNTLSVQYIYVPADPVQ